MAENLVPASNDAELRSRALVFLYSNLDEKASKACMHILMLQKS
jgi:hypothetical protein